MSKRNFNLVTREVDELTPYVRNARTHSEAQIAQIAASIQEFGFTNPVLIDAGNTIIAGEGRVLAAKKLKLLTVQCIVLSGLTEAQKAAYVIADNKLAANAGWNTDMLFRELVNLSELSIDTNLTGFDQVEIMALLNELDTNVPEVGAVGAGPSGEVGAAPDWSGMPDFDQPNAGPFRTVLVHLKDQASVDAFATLIGQRLTDKTKYVWHPQQVKAAATGVVYV